jgi:hypothetical protein
MQGVGAERLLSLVNYLFPSPHEIWRKNFRTERYLASTLCSTGLFRARMNEYLSSQVQR